MVFSCAVETWSVCLHIVLQMTAMLENREVSELFCKLNWWLARLSWWSIFNMHYNYYSFSRHELKLQHWTQSKVGEISPSGKYFAVSRYADVNLICVKAEYYWVNFLFTWGLVSLKWNCYKSDLIQLMWHFKIACF